MRNRLLYSLIIASATALGSAGAAGVFAQEAQPIDQAVGDIDPLARGLRRVEWGLRSDGQQTSLIRVPTPASDALYTGLPSSDGQAYYRVGPGFRARVDRLDYLVRRGSRGVALNQSPRRDGEFRDLIPAGTVFDLRPDPLPMVSSPALLRPQTPMVSPPQRLSSRVDRRIDRRVGTQPQK